MTGLTDSMRANFSLMKEISNHCCLKPDYRNQIGGEALIKEFGNKFF